MAAKIDYQKFSYKELLDMLSDMEQNISAKREQQRLDLRKQMAKMAEDAGFASLEEVIGRPRGKKSPPVAKYRNPADPSQTWSGRGRKPQWLLDRLQKGERQDKFLIA